MRLRKLRRLSSREKARDQAPLFRLGRIWTYFAFSLNRCMGVIRQRALLFRRRPFRAVSPLPARSPSALIRQQILTSSIRNCKGCFKNSPGPVLFAAEGFRRARRVTAVSSPCTRLTNVNGISGFVRIRRQRCSIIGEERSNGAVSRCIPATGNRHGETASV